MIYGNIQSVTEVPHRVSKPLYRVKFACHALMPHIPWRVEPAATLGEKWKRRVCANDLWKGHASVWTGDRALDQWSSRLVGQCAMVLHQVSLPHTLSCMYGQVRGDTTVL
jgi:hypothetical protein